MNEEQQQMQRIVSAIGQQPAVYVGAIDLNTDNNGNRIPALARAYQQLELANEIEKAIARGHKDDFPSQWEYFMRQVGRR